MISSYIKIYNNTSPINFNFFLISILLSIPAILLGEWAILVLPLIVLIILSYIYGERFIIALILISLFTLVGELNRSLRTAVQLIDLTLLGFLFIRSFGFNFNIYPRVPKPIIYFLILYFSAMVISSAVSAYPSAAIGIITQQFAFFVIVYVFYSLIKDERDIHNYLFAIMIVAFILATVSLVLLFSTGFSLLDTFSKNRVRVSALITNAEASSNFYLISFPFIIVLFLIKKNTLYRIITLLVALYFFLGLSLAMSRSAILGIVLSTAIVFFILRRRRFYQFALSIIILSLLFIFIEPLNEILRLFLRIEEGVSARDYIWSMSLNIIRDYPVFGMGPGVYKYKVFNYFPYMFDSWWGGLMIYFYDITDGVNFSHNFFLVLFTEMGILGLMTAVTLPLIYIKIGIKTIKRYKNEIQEKYYLIVALFAIGISIIFRNFFNSIGILYLGGITTDLPFWLIFGSLVYFYRVPFNVNFTLQDEHTVRR